jgi:hypothetical protein
MRNAATCQPLDSPRAEAAPVFSVVIAYEDFHAGKQAKQAYDFLVENLSHEWQVTSQMWKFDVLSVRELREMAARDAAMADLIIVSTNSQGEFPADVKTWIEMWLGYRGGAVALVALFNQPPKHAEQARMTQAYLEGVANRGQMEFFTWPNAWPEQEGSPERAMLDRHWETTGETLIPLAALRPREESLSHWGINE